MNFDKTKKKTSVGAKRNCLHVMHQAIVASGWGQKKKKLLSSRATATESGDHTQAHQAQAQRRNFGVFVFLCASRAVYFG